MLRYQRVNRVSVAARRVGCARYGPGHKIMAQVECNEVLERAEMAERWRQLGQKLRRRSPRMYLVMTRLIAEAAIDDQDDGDIKIDSVYQIH